MKLKNLSLLISLLFVINLSAQSLDEKYLDKVDSIDNIIQTLYGVISGEKGEDRNWELLQYIYHPNAKLIASGPNNDGIYKARYLTPFDYVENSGPWLIENGFFENEIHREVNKFGNLANVFSTYECFHSQTETKPFMRGINSIQLLNDGKRWWVVGIFWTQETPENPIPKEYLPKT